MFLSRLASKLLPLILLMTIGAMNVKADLSLLVNATLPGYSNYARYFIARICPQGTYAAMLPEQLVAVEKERFLASLSRMEWRYQYWWTNIWWWRKDAGVSSETYLPFETKRWNVGMNGKTWLINNVVRHKRASQAGYGMVVPSMRLTQPCFDYKTAITEGAQKVEMELGDPGEIHASGFTPIRKDIELVNAELLPPATWWDVVQPRGVPVSGSWRYWRVSEDWEQNKLNSLTRKSHKIVSNSIGTTGLESLPGVQTVEASCESGYSAIIARCLFKYGGDDAVINWVGGLRDAKCSGVLLGDDSRMMLELVCVKV